MMGAETKISWCDSTFNPWIGCTKVSPACANCYAEALMHRWGKGLWGPGKPRQRTSAACWRQPLKWEAEAARTGHLLDGVEHHEFPLLGSEATHD